MASSNGKQAVFDAIEKNRDECIETVSKIVRIPSLHGEETRAQAFMADLYRTLDLAVDIFEADKTRIQKHPAYIDIPYEYEDRPNVVGSKKGEGGGRSLILNGHVDVVSPEPTDRWTVDPWGGEIKEGRIYGRGVFDMKGGLIANFFALKAIAEAGIRLKGDLILQSVIEEEPGGSGGALACFLRGYTAGGMVVPEPSRLQVVTCHNGVKYFRVRVTGKTAHAALSHTGVNAVGKMNKIYDALIALDQKRAAEHSFPLIEKYSGRSCNLNIGVYRAGDWASSVAGMAEMECRIGFVPGEKGEEIVKAVTDTINGVAAADEWMKDHPPEVEWYGWDTEPWFQDENDPFVASFLSSTGALMGRPPEIVGFPGGLDTRFGPYFNTPSLVYGPDGDRYHGPDEYVTIDSLMTVTRVLANFVLDWCEIA